MKFGTSKIGVGLFTVVLLFGLVIVACDSDAPQNLEIPINIFNGEMKPDTIEVKQGDTVTLTVESDEVGDFHLHTYDIEKEVGGSGQVDVVFVADATGRFRITFHATGGEHEEREADHEEGEDKHEEEHEEVDLGFLEVSPR